CRASAIHQQCRQQRRTRGHDAQNHMFVSGVSAVAHRSEPIEGGNTQRGSEVAIRTSPHGAIRESEAQLSGQRFGASKKSRADLALERRAGKAAADLEARAWQDRAETAQSL